MKNPSNKAAERFMRAQGFKPVPHGGASYKLFDTGGHCASIVDIKRSAQADKVMLVIDRLADMADNFADACAKLDGRVIDY